MLRLSLSACLLIATLPACRCSSEPVATATPIKGLPPSSPPTPGHATLTLRGALKDALDADGVDCGEGGAADSFWVGAPSAGGPGAQPRWLLSYLPSRGASVSVPTSDGKFDLYRAPSPKGVRRVDEGFQIEQELKSDSGDVVIVSGSVSCPSWPQSVVPAPLLAFMRAATNTEPRPYSTYDFGRAQSVGAASVVVPEADARDVLVRLRSGLSAGWVAYIGTTRWLGDEKHPGGAEVVVGPGKTKFDILRLARTDAVNYDMGTEDLIGKLAEWDETYGIDILHAETDTLEVSLKRTPSVPLRFAGEVYEFCPDSVDQGVGSLEALARVIRESGEIYLWWD